MEGIGDGMRMEVTMTRSKYSIKFRDFQSLYPI